MNIKLVAHKSEDYWKLVALRTEILRIPLGLRFTDAELEAEGKQKHYGLFEGEVALACMVLVEQENGRVKMRQVCTAAHQQGKNLGTQLLAYCEEEMRLAGMKVMHCNARKAAMAFYFKNNYKALGAEFLEVGLPHYYLEKEL